MDHVQKICSTKYCKRVGYCPLCDGGLFICTVCNGAEGSLPSECPGRRMTPQESAEVYEGLVDFVKGKWQERCSVHSPHSYWSKKEKAHD